MNVIDYNFIYNNNMYKYFLIIIVCIYLYYIINNIKIENFENFEKNIIFIEKNELFNILKKDSDNYYKSFYRNDLIVRNINNEDDYIKLIDLSIDNFNEYEKNKIIKCINDINIIFKNINYDWFNGIKANNISWKIGCIKGKLYENGLPHTRNDIIIISKEDINKLNFIKLKKTLIHEKVHIYQKIYNNDVQKYLFKNKFTKFKTRNEYDNIRANPDLDNIIYKDNNNTIYKAIYNTNPKSVEDITYFPINTQLYEHPFERMAIEIENNIIY